MSTIVSGSIAYDYIMDFGGHFTDHILADQIHKLNISFVIDKLQRYYGGCAPNIAYSLALLGESVQIVGTAGRDFSDYKKHLKQFPQIDLRNIAVVKEELTACAYINSDLNSNQITAFYPGASRLEYNLPSAGKLKEIKWAIVGPENKLMMLKNLENFNNAGKNSMQVIFDSGQMTPYFTRVEWQQIFALTDTLILNDYEMELVERNTAMGLAEINKQVKTIIITQGSKGSVIHVAGKQVVIPTASPTAVIDPTGAGDAYRSGLLLGMRHDCDWETAGRLGALSATYALENRGTQCHNYTMDEFLSRFHENFGYNLEI